MRSSIRIGWRSVVFIASGMVAGALAFAPAAEENAATEIVDPIPSPFVDPEQLREYHDLTARQEAVLARIARKREVAAELIRGQITLSEAAAQFAEIALCDPRGLDFLRMTFPTGTDEERHYRNVIVFVRGEFGASTGPGALGFLNGSKPKSRLDFRSPRRLSGLLVRDSCCVPSGGIQVSEDPAIPNHDPARPDSARVAGEGAASRPAIRLPGCCT